MAEDTLRSSTGSDVESLCSKCGDVWHVVLDHDEGVVDRCQCKECGKTQRYKPTDPRLLAALLEHRKRRRARPRRATARGGTGRARTKVSEGARVTIDPSRPLVAYDIKASYLVADQIEHARFGRGVVTALLGPAKMSVEFVGTGEKILMYRRA